jgi:hypothetical protein
MVNRKGATTVNEVEMSRYITDTFEGVDVVVNSDNSFFFYNPDSSVPPDHMFPFVTLMTNDINDQFSNLNRPSVFRLNIGVSKQTFRSLFGLPEKRSDSDSPDVNSDDLSGYDFTAMNQIMPHPVYGRQYWVCIINPSDETLKTKVLPLMTEAYEMAVGKYDKKSARR